MKIPKFAIVTARYLLSFIFLWAFFDKVFGLGFATKPEQAWIHGESPTAYFLGHVVHGPFVGLFNALSGVPFVDWLFMFGLLFVGCTLLFNKYTRIGALVGSVILALMYLSLIPPANNPIVDEHLIYICVLVYIGAKAESWKD